MLNVTGFSDDKGEDSYSAAVDVWSLGCILACMHHNAPTPFPSITDTNEAVALIASGKLAPQVPSNSHAPSFRPHLT